MPSGMNHEELTRLRAAFESMAAAFGFYRTQLIEQGFSAEEALRLVMAAQTQLLGSQR